METLKIDQELKDLLPPMTDDEYKRLENDIVKNGFNKLFPIMTWNGFIADGHNRYEICKKHNIEFTSAKLAYETKDQVMKWMIDIQLGRRNLSAIQKIAVAEKYRPVYERQAKENQGRRTDLVVNLPQSKNDDMGRTSEKLSKIAGVSEKTYRMGAKILNSDNEELKERVLSGETKISAGYKELNNDNKKEVEERECIIEQETPPLFASKEVPKINISADTKQICADLKTEKSQEYLESIWDYKISIIDCMDAGFNRFFDGFISILQEMSGRVTRNELEECILHAKELVEKMDMTINIIKNNSELKAEDED